MATLRELAERTGYSAATISRILSGDPALSVSMEARRKVLEEAGRLNYTATRSRRGRAPKGVLRVGIAEMLTPAQQLEDPFYLYLSGFVRQGCLDRKYTAVPLESRGEGFLTPEGEALDGIIAIGKFRSGQIAALESICPQIVFLNSSPLESRFDSVVLNFSLGISMALEHLVELGHRSVGFIGPEWKLDDLGRPGPRGAPPALCPADRGPGTGLPGLAAGLPHGDGGGCPGGGRASLRRREPSHGATGGQ